MLHFNMTLMILFGMLCSDIVRSEAAGCHYQYDVQPGPTTETCDLTGTSGAFLVLKCQVSSDRNNSFSINWRYSRSRPDISDIASATYIDGSITTLHSNVTTTSSSSSSTRRSLTSRLELRGFDDKGDGYFWCGVDSSNDAQTVTPNPSMVLHISHRYCSVGQTCTKPICLYESYSTYTARCADQEVSVNVIEAQDCTAAVTPAEETCTSRDTDSFTTTKPTTFLQSTTQQTPALQTTGQETLAQQTTGQQTTNLYSTALQTTSQHDATTVTSVAPSLSLGVETVIGISMGGLVLILCFVIGLLAMCVMKMKRKHRIREHRTDPISPFDDIVMYSSVKKLEIEKVDDADRVSKMFCEPNSSYECSHVTLSHHTDNIYDYIY